MQASARTRAHERLLALARVRFRVLCRTEGSQRGVCGINMTHRPNQDQAMLFSIIRDLVGETDQFLSGVIGASLCPSHAHSGYWRGWFHRVKFHLAADAG